MALTMKAFSVAAVGVLMTEVAGKGSCPTPHADQKSCDADSACTWCACSALPSACWTKKDAKNLPGAVYTCDGVADDAADDVGAEEGTEEGDLKCDLCKDFVKEAKGQALTKCHEICEKFGQFKPSCGKVCALVATQATPEKVCELVKFCKAPTTVPPPVVTTPAPIVTTQAPSGTTAQALTSDGLPPSIVKEIEKLVCQAVKDEVPEDKFASTTCEDLKKAIKFLPEQTCEDVVKKIFEDTIANCPKDIVV